MTIPPIRTAIQWTALTALFVALGYAASAGMVPRSPPVTVSQKGQMFSISVLDVSSGETVRIVNDETVLPHHAYVDSETFRFDSGDQAPGSTTDITFPVSGTFAVLCGIHPKMKLTVYVK